MLVLVMVAVLLSSPRHGPRRPAASGQSPASGHAARQPARVAPRRPAVGQPSAPLARMLGQMVVASFAGTTPSASLLERIRAGEVGGVILFAGNFAAGLAQARSTIGELQRAASEGGNPPLLVMTDQEGGEVSRMPGPPTLAPSEMTSPSIAYEQGRATAKAMRAAGIDVDLAPVADVPRVAGSFLGTRTFGDSAPMVAANACAFARGLASERVAYTLKHFPGLGRTTASTDSASVSIGATASALRSDYAPYAACGREPLALVMVSSAIYPSLTGPFPAVMSPLTYDRELPRATLGNPAVTISDDLEAAALRSEHAPAAHAINAGLDLLLYAGTQQASADAYAQLLADARSGGVSTARIQRAYDAILALKQRLTSS